jgi:hypothetical protein
MQIPELALNGLDRPRQCKHCGNTEKMLHRHGPYPRYANVEGAEKVLVQRFLCPVCHKTMSIIPKTMLPYRCMPTPRLEVLFDERFDFFSEGGRRPRPPPARELERGCLLRAHDSLQKHYLPLCHVLGQRIPIRAQQSVDAFWKAIRTKLGGLEDILLYLWKNFKTSLLRDYKTHQYAF